MNSSLMSPYTFEGCVDIISKLKFPLFTTVHNHFRVCTGCFLFLFTTISYRYTEILKGMITPTITVSQSVSYSVIQSVCPSFIQ